MKRTISAVIIVENRCFGGKMHDFDLHTVSRQLGIESEIAYHTKALIAKGSINDSEELKNRLKQLVLSWYPNLHIYFPGLKAGV
jgi:hypothetical protein